LRQYFSSNDLPQGRRPSNHPEDVQISFSRKLIRNKSLIRMLTKARQEEANHGQVKTENGKKSNI